MSDDDYPDDVYAPDVEAAVIGSGGTLPWKGNPRLRQRKRRGVFRTVAADGVLKCHYCKQTFPVTELTEDHIVPKSRGGSNKIRNITPACVPCNSAKGDAWPTCTCSNCRSSIDWHGKALGITEATGYLDKTRTAR